MRTLTSRELNRALLARQHLLERSALGVPAMLTHLAGMQAQEPKAPYTGLWNRIAGFDPRALEAEIIEHRAVRIALHRSTIHLVTATDAHAMRPVFEPMLAQRFRTSTHGKALPGLDVAAVVADGRTLLDEKPLTFAELGKALSQSHDGDPTDLAMAVRNHAALVQTPPRGLWTKGGLARHATLDAWAPAAGPPMTVDGLVLRYLAAFGPATAADAQAWSGLTKLSEVLERLAPQLEAFTNEDGATLYDLPDAPRPEPGVEAPVRFLPPYDNVFLAFADRTRIHPAEHKDAFFSRNGVVPAGVLVDGVLAATWRNRKTGFELNPLRPFTKREQGDLEAEQGRLQSFLATQA